MPSRLPLLPCPVPIRPSLFREASLVVVAIFPCGSNALYPRSLNPFSSSSCVQTHGVDPTGVRGLLSWRSRLYLHLDPQEIRLQNAEDKGIQYKRGETKGGKRRLRYCAVAGKKCALRERRASQVMAGRCKASAGRQKVQVRRKQQKPRRHRYASRYTIIIKADTNLTFTSVQEGSSKASEAQTTGELYQ